MQKINNYLEVLCLTYLAIVTSSNIKNRLKRTNRKLESKGSGMKYLARPGQQSSSRGPIGPCVSSPV